MKKWLDIGTNLVVIAMAATLVFTFFYFRLAPWQQTRPTAEVQAGATLKPILGATFAPAGDTLLLAVRKGCEFCEGSMPFYKNLLALRSEGKISVPVVAVLPDAAGIAKQFLTSYGVSLPIVPGVSLDTIGVTGTPTMILINAKRTVQQVWVGEQSQIQQAGVIAELESLGSSAASGATRREAASARN